MCGNLKQLCRDHNNLTVKALRIRSMKSLNSLHQPKDFAYLVSMRSNTDNGNVSYNWTWKWEMFAKEVSQCLSTVYMINGNVCCFLYASTNLLEQFLPWCSIWRIWERKLFSKLFFHSRSVFCRTEIFLLLSVVLAISPLLMTLKDRMRRQLRSSAHLIPEVWRSLWDPRTISGL